MLVRSWPGTVRSVRACAKLRCRGLHVDRPDGGAGALGGYRPAPRLAGGCGPRIGIAGSGCRRPGSQCDLDHVVPFPAGGTCADNLAPLCRYHHRLKTHANWRVQALGGGHLRWTSPRGELRHLPARPIGTGRLCPATARYLMPDPADHPCGFGLPGSRQAGPDRPVYATRA